MGSANSIKRYITLAGVTAALAGCGSSPDERIEGPIGTAEEGASAAEVDLDVCAPGAGGFSLTSTHPYYPIALGLEWRLEGEEDGAFLVVQATVLDETEMVAGVSTRVVEEREWEDGELVELSRNYVAQASDGTVCYFGEAVDMYEDGEVTHEGAWRADEPGNAPGILMPADPRPGTMFQMESAPEIAMDQGKVVGSGPVEVPAGEFTDVIRIREVNPLDGDKGYKQFAAGVGLVLDEDLELVSY